MKTLTNFLKEFMLLRLRESNLYDPVGTYYIKDTNNNIEMIIYLINESLKKLYTDYPLLQKSCLLEVEPIHTYYKLRPEFAVTSNSTEPHKYIKDSVYNPFYGNLIKILSITGSNNIRLPINSYNDPNSVFLSEPDVIQFSLLENNAETDYKLYYDINYQANHLPLVTNINFNNQYITLPDSLFELLNHYLAYKTMLTFQTKNHAVEAQKHYLLYIELKNALEANGTLYTAEQSMNNTFDANQIP